MPASGVSRPASPGLLLSAGLCFVLEVLFFTHWRNCLGPYWSPVVFIALGLGLCLLTARAVLDQRFEWPAAAGRPWAVRLGVAVFFTALSWLIVSPLVLKYIGQQPLDTIGPVSDIIPALQVYVSRFLNGEVVYQPISLLGYTFLPNYPPLQWLPFVPATLSGTDYRLWAFGALVLGLLVAYQWQLARLALPWAEWLLKAALPVLVLHFSAITDKDMYGLTVESLIVGYYCVLAMGTLHDRPWLKALGLVLCLLSRFSLALWVPLYGLLLLWQHRPLAWRTAGLALLGGVAIFGPFLLSDPTIFLRAQLENLDIAVGAWQNINALDVPPRPYHLFNGLGMAAWFYDLPGTLTQRIVWLQTTQLAACAAVVGLSGALFWRFRHRFDPRLAALLSLKAYLVIFYGFIIIPFSYLASVSLFTSLLVVLLLSRRPPFLVPAAATPE